MPKYVSLSTPSLMDKPFGKLRSIIVLMDSESDLALVIKGEILISKGLESMGPGIAWKPTSSSIYLST